MAKEFYDKVDIMNLLKCGESRALAIIRSVKDYTGDMLGVRGKILVTEYEAWKQRPLASKNA